MRGRALNLLAAGAAGLFATAALAAPSASAVTPFADCVVMPQSPAVTAKVYFGYVNAGSQQSIGFGDANQVVPGLGFQGQPQVFNVGTYERVFSAIWNTQAFPWVRWELDGGIALADATTPTCVAGATGPLSDLTPTSATLNGFAGVAGQQSTYRFEWGAGADFDVSSSPTTIGPGHTSAVELTLVGLRPQTLYRYRLLAEDADGVTTGATRTFTTPAAPLAPVDLALTQQLAPAALPAGGGTAVATLTVTNTSATDAASGVVATDLLPEAATFLPARSPGCSAAERVVSCPLGALAPGATATAEVAFATSATGAAVNTAIVVGEQPDPQRLNDIAAAAVTVAAPLPTDDERPVENPPDDDPPRGTPFSVTARALAARAVPAAARRCARRAAAALAITSSAAASATVTAARGRTTVASRRVALRRGRTVVVLCLNARGLRAARGRALAATARVAARAAGGRRATARIPLRFARR